ncbi:hypothetical protein ACFXPR_31730 [Nocardia tengchongensis]|uniref:hypothetical protein n=1 Tax=Nocardia tengchongensis TaxID=2055889 RepID=UPI0036AA629B
MNVLAAVPVILGVDGPQGLVPFEQVPQPAPDAISSAAVLNVSRLVLTTRAVRRGRHGVPHEVVIGSGPEVGGAVRRDLGRG